MKTIMGAIVVGVGSVFFGAQALAVSPVFTRDLYYGIRGDSEVTELQEFLSSENIYSGPITGNFFSLTLSSVRAFQAREGIVPSAGYFGPVTRKRANNILSAQIVSSDNQAVSETGIVPPVATNTIGTQIDEILRQIAYLQQQLNNQTATTTQTQTPPSNQVIIPAPAVGSAQPMPVQEKPKQTTPPSVSFKSVASSLSGTGGSVLEIARLKIDGIQSYPTRISDDALFSIISESGQNYTAYMKYGDVRGGGVMSNEANTDRITFTVSNAPIGKTRIKLIVKELHTRDWDGNDFIPTGIPLETQWIDIDVE